MTAGQAIGNGRKTVAASATSERLATETMCSAVCITAETDNTGVIVVGDSTVIAALATRQGTPLAAGDSMELNVSNLSSIWLDTTVNGDGVTFTYIN